MRGGKFSMTQGKEHNSFIKQFYKNNNNKFIDNKNVIHVEWSPLYVYSMHHSTGHAG